MKRQLVLALLLFLGLWLVGCDEAEEADEDPEAAEGAFGERPPDEGEVQPPIPYEVGETKPTPGVERGVNIDIVVEAGVYRDELESLFTWFQEVWYSDRKLIQVDVYDTWEAAQALNFDAGRVLATYRYTHPNHRDVQIYDERLIAGQRENEREDYRSGTHPVYLGPRSRMFGSQDQAQYLLNMMEDVPDKRVYEVSWLSRDFKVILSYDATSLMLVRVNEGIGRREVWQGFSIEQLEQAATGMGFGGQSSYGGEYLLLEDEQEIPEP